MKLSGILSHHFICILFVSGCIGCNSIPNRNELSASERDGDRIEVDSISLGIAAHSSHTDTLVINRDVAMKNYFSYMDSLISQINGTTNYLVDEYVLVFANPWILDTLISYDYYTRKESGIVLLDQREAIILKKGEHILIPDSMLAAHIHADLTNTRIDVNIPEYKLRIIQNDTVLYSLDVRVGKNKKKYLKLAGHTVDLRTPIGEGEIIRIEKNPLYINPVDGHRYHATIRDDGTKTNLPIIPFLEPIIHGERHGSLIHPTTNIKTLGSAISNGCVGTSEASAWLVYYYAPLGTKVSFRYDTLIVNDLGDTTFLKNIYHLKYP